MINSYFNNFLIIVISLLFFSACSSSKKLGSSKNVDQINIQDNNSGGNSVNPRANQGIKYNSTRSNMESKKDSEKKQDENDKKEDK